MPLEIGVELLEPEAPPLSDTCTRGKLALAHESIQRRALDVQVLGRFVDREKRNRPPTRGVEFCGEMAHCSMMCSSDSERENGDETRLSFYERCPAACDRLEIFYWEWVSDRNPERYRDWVRQMRKPISQAMGVNTSGLLEAAEEVAASVQRELHERPSPLTMLEADELWYWRRRYLNPLLYLGGGGQRLAKEVEARAAPNGQPLAICLGSTNRPERVMTVRGPMTLHGYWDA